VSVVVWSSSGWSMFEGWGGAFEIRSRVPSSVMEKQAAYTRGWKERLEAEWPRRSTGE
jgi:hypothetical protein